MSEHTYWNQLRDIVESGHQAGRPKHEIREKIVHLVHSAEAAGEDWAGETLTRWASTGADDDYTRAFKSLNTVTYIRKDGRRVRRTVGYSRPMRAPDSGEIVARQMQAWWGMSRIAIVELRAEMFEQADRLADIITVLGQLIEAMDRHPDCATAADAWIADGRSLDEIQLDVAA
jgi:hypothetical protein